MQEAAMRTKYVLTQDLVIPAGEEFFVAPREVRGGAPWMSAVVGFGKDFTGELVVQAHPDAIASGYFEEVPITKRGRKK
jgi:hypothetical protein